MNFNPNLQCSKVDQTKALEEYAALLNRNVQSIVKGAYNVRFLLNEDQFNLLSKMLYPRPIALINPIYNPHPVAATMNLLAYEECIETAAHFNHRAIDVGGSLLRTPGKHHLCAKIEDSRCDARYIESAIIGAARNTLVYKNINFTDKGQDVVPYNNRTTNCTKGVEFCNVKAPYMYAINVYDIDLKKLTKAMLRHDTVICDVWMFLPLTLVDPAYEEKNVCYTTTIFEQNRKMLMRFSLNDGSNDYVHDYHQWKQYLTTTKVVYKNVAFVIEHKKNFGRFTQIRVTRVNELSGSITRTIGLGDFKTMIIVPNVVKYIDRNKFGMNQFFYKIIVKKEFVATVLDYGQRQKDDQFNWSAFTSYCDGRKNNVYISLAGQQQVAYEGLSTTCGLYDDLKMSLFLICAIRRYKRTKRIAEAFNFIKNNQPGWFSEFKQYLRNWFRTAVKDGSKVMHNEKYDDTYFERIDTSNDHYIFNLRVKEIDDVSYSDVIKCAGEYTIIPYIMNPTAGVQALTKKYLMEKPITTAIPVAISKASPEEVAVFNEEEYYDSEVAKPSEDVDSHYSVLYDPPGDGACGLHCFREFLKRTTKKQLKFPRYKLKGNNVIFPEEWLDYDDMHQIANLNGLNIIVHAVRAECVVIKEHWSDDWPTIKLTNKNQHWFLVDCNCGLTKHYVGNYRNLTISREELYVNAANFQLRDAAGQALDFRQMFHEYDTDLNLPLKQRVTFTRDINGIHLCLAVAYDNSSVKDVGKTKAAMVEIISSIDAYAIKNDLLVNLPLIGTGVYRGDLCCLKKEIAKMKCRYKLCFFDERSERNYINTRDCTHAGYKLANPQMSLIKSKSTNYSRSHYDQVDPEHDPLKMQKKFADYIAIINERFYCISPADRIIEISGAPGDFSRVYDSNFAGKFNYEYWHYAGVENFSIRYGKPTATWKTHQELFELIRQSEANHYLLDWPINSECKMWVDLINNIKHRCTFTVKMKVYNEQTVCDEFVNNITSPMLIWRNHASEPTSCETYVTISTQTPCIKVKDFDFCHYLNDVDKTTLAAQQSREQCQHDHGDIIRAINATASWNNNINDYHAYLDTLIMDPLLSSMTLDLVKLKDMPLPDLSRIDLITGVGGSKKTTGIVKESCSKCCMIISPLRESAANVNSIRNLATTYILAFKKLARQYKYIYMDEFLFTNPYAYIACKMLSPSSTFIGLTDPNQIQNVDFTKTSPIVSTQVKNYNTVTFRTPQALIHLLNGVVPNITTRSGEVGVLTYERSLNKNIVDDNHVSKKGIYTFLCFTQRMKNQLRDAGLYAMTVTEAMGTTINKVALIIEDVHELTGGEDLKRRYLYTAVGRTREQLMVIGTEEDQAYFHRTLGVTAETEDVLTPLLDAVEKLAVPPLPTVNKVKFDLPADNPIVKTSELDLYRVARGEQKFIVRHKLIKTPSSKTRIEKGGRVLYTSALLEDITETVTQYYNVVNENPFHIIVYGSNDELKQVLKILQSPIERVLDVGGVVPIDNLSFKNVQNTNSNKEPLRLEGYQCDLQTIQEIMDSVFHSVNDYSIDVINYKGNIIKENMDDHNCKVSGELLKTSDVKIQGARLLSRTYQVEYHGKDAIKLINTMIGRYAKPTKHLKWRYVERYIKGFQYWLKPNWQKLMPAVNNDELFNGVREYLIELQKKFPKEYTEAFSLSEQIVHNSLIKTDDDRMLINNIFDQLLGTGVINNGIKKCVEDRSRDLWQTHNKALRDTIDELMDDETNNKTHDITKEWYEPSQRIIKFHMKRQPKLILTDKYDLEDKDGQGISAWSKLINVLMSAMTRTYNSRLLSHVKDNVKIAFGESDAEISETFAHYTNVINDKSTTKLSMDFSEFDSSQEEKGIMASLAIFRMLGYPESIIKFYMDMRKSWTLLAANNDGMARLLGLWKQHSGQPFTLCGNTTYNMAVLGAAFIYKGLHFASFKGDDSFIVCDSVSERMVSTTSLLIDAKLKIKIVKDPIPEYIANIITPCGFFPDVLRRVSRVVSRVYTNSTDWEAMMLSMADCLQVIKSPEYAYTGAQVASLFYKQLGIHLGPDTILQMLTFLHELTYNRKYQPTEIKQFLFRVVDVGHLITPKIKF